MCTLSLSTLLLLTFTTFRKMEQTFILVKPDAVQRALVGEIISRFEKKGYFLRGLKFTKADRPTIEKHYKNFVAKPFFDTLVDYMISSPVVAMVWEGKDVIAGGRKLIGLSDPLATMPGTIRGDFSIDIGRKIQHGNVIHGSDSLEEAKNEIALWFPEEEHIVNWQSSLEPWIYE